MRHLIRCNDAHSCFDFMFISLFCSYKRVICARVLCAHLTTCGSDIFLSILRAWLWPHTLNIPSSIHMTSFIYQKHSTWNKRHSQSLFVSLSLGAFILCCAAQCCNLNSFSENIFLICGIMHYDLHLELDRVKPKKETKHKSSAKRV